MKTIDTVLLTTLICSLVWLGGTSHLINGYIKVASQEEYNMLYLESELGNSKQLTKQYETLLKLFIWKCQNKDTILLAKKSFKCYKILKV